MIRHVPIHRLAGSAAVAVLLGLAVLTAPAADPAGERLTSRPRPAVTDVKPAAVGDEVRTDATQRRRLRLRDGTVVLVNRDTALKVAGERRLHVTAGEVVVVAAPGRGDDAAFVVVTPKRELSAPAGTFAVRAAKDGTGVLVARGRVSISGLDEAVRAGQQLTATAEKPTAAPRTSHLLDWARELMASAESPLVPASQYGGGAIIAVDPDGQEAKLSLRKYHIDVHVEDGFARTTIDQTYFNHTAARLEGTFYFPLPPDASLSRLAMYVDGKLMEGGMVERDFGRQVYEKIVTSQRDPALLEWLDGSTFKMRVFPLEARQEKRIILSYAQRLPSLYGDMQYRFPAGHTLDAVGDWSFHARVKGGADFNCVSPSHDLHRSKDGADLLLDASEKNVKANRDVVLTFGEVGEGQEEAARFSSFEQDGAKYLLLRYRPALDARNDQRAEGRNWVFLFESSGDRDPLLARTQIEVIRGLLANAEPDDTFAVLAAGTRVRAFADKPRPVTPENVAEALAFLEQSHLIGALDLGQALAAAEPFLKAGKDAHLVHVGSGVAAMGERRDDVLAKRLPEGVRYVGVGVGRRLNRNLMKQAAERTGGYFTQINPDEVVGWRAFDLSATLNTPRLLDVSVADKTGQATFLAFTNMAAQGEELCAVARVGSGEALPEMVAVRGRLNGAAFARDIPVKGAKGNVGHLPRTWAKLEIERLLAEDARKNREAIVGLSKAMYVMTPYTSLLVLENEEMYQQYKVDRGRKDHWALYPCPEKVEVVYEPLEGMPPDPKAKGKPSARDVSQTVLLRSENHYSGPIGGGGGGSSDDGRKLAPPLSPLLWAVDQREHRPLSARSRNKSESFIELVQTSQDGAVLRSPRVRAGLPDDPATPESARLVAQWLRPLGESTNPSTPQNDSFGGTGSGQGFLDDRKLAARLPMDLAEASIPQSLSLETGKPDDSASLPYRRPRFPGEDRLFFDLVSYASGMDTSRADLLAVVEAEATPSAMSKPGDTTTGAQRLFDNARLHGWKTITYPTAGDQPAFSITFDGTGRYSYERTVPPGIRERVVCDGKTLLHLYPDLGLGARRTVSRFHRLEFARAVPWGVPAAEDVARGADLKLVGERTVAVVPHGADGRKDADGKPLPYATVQYVFAEEGRLAERRVVEMPTKKVVYRQMLGADGRITGTDADGKELAVVKATLRDAREPDLKVDAKGLVVLPLPYRDVATTRKALGIEKKPLNALTFDEARALLAAEFGAGNASGAVEVCQQSLFRRDQKQLGLYVLLAACGVNLDSGNVDILNEHLHEPLAQYLALHSSPVLRRHASQWAVGSGQWRDGYLQHLAVTHALFQRWSNGKALGATDEKRREERERALDYVRRNKGTAFGWGLLCLMKDRADEDEGNKRDVRDSHKALAEAWPLFREVPALAYAAEYEHARSLWKAGQHTEARQRFVDLYERTVKEGGLPRIDADFRQALLGDGPEVDLWADLMRKTAAGLIEGKKRPAVLALAAQCRQVGDESLASALLATALDRIKEDEERQGMTLAAIDFLAETGQFAEADRLLQTLLDDAELAKKPELWRLAGRLAGRRDQPAQQFECLERALDAEYRNLPEVIDLSSVRDEYGRLLGHYQSLADALERLKMRPPTDFVARVVRTADRWRALDPEADGACETAGRILRTVGERELVWDYLTTPVGRRPNESAPWVALATTLSRTGELGLADRAYAAAFEAEPTDAQILWDRAQNLCQAGKTTEAQKLYRQLAEGDWQPRFNWVRTQAKWQLEKR
ncbi:MAG TPA: VIT domain-containing protein [Gemmataceae bacterium]|nr:VIT domain-containing protein [Gemmataceae bacterium]